MLMGFYMEALLQYMVSALKLFLTGCIEYRVMHIDIVMIENSSELRRTVNKHGGR